MPAHRGQASGPCAKILSPAELFSACNWWQQSKSQQRSDVWRASSSLQHSPRAVSNHDTAEQLVITLLLPFPTQTSSSRRDLFSPVAPPRPGNPPALVFYFCSTIGNSKGRSLLLHKQFYVWIENRFQGWHCQCIYYFKDHLYLYKYIIFIYINI